MHREIRITVTTIWATLFLLPFSGASKIVAFPGQPKVSFQQYGGYITIDAQQQRSLFYYFVEAETEPASKPLVLWLNGGPGCSSIGAGAFSEHGPFRPSGDILVKNDFSWNKEANMLYLESPAGVGFSYSANKSFYASVNDDITAQDNLAFLELWFEEFPEYKDRDFFITGESYAGHYVPQLVLLIIRSNTKFNLKGIAMGNPLLDFNSDLNSRAEYLWSHGLISDASLELLMTVCNYSQITRQSQNGSLSPVCNRVSNQVSSEVSDSVDKYDVTLDVCLSLLESQSRKLNQLEHMQEIDVCVQDETEKYLRRKDVQNAFHAKLVGVDEWTFCSRVIDYEMDNLEIPMLPILEKLVRSGIRVLVYRSRFYRPFISTRALVYRLAKQLELNTTTAYRAWFVQKQVGGWTQVYGDFLSFATIRGASHEAPFSQPERSLELFKEFLRGKPLPPASLLTKKIRD